LPQLAAAEYPHFYVASADVDGEYPFVAHWFHVRQYTRSFSAAAT